MIGLLALLGAGCKASYPFQPSNPVPTALQIHYRTPMGPALVGQSFGLNAYVLDSDGGLQDVTANSTWVSSNTNVIGLTTSPSGFTAIAPGAADISATYQNVSNTVSLSVIEPDRQFPVLTVNLANPVAPPHHIGQRGALSAVLRLSTTQTQNVTSQATWRSSDPRVVLVASDGTVSAISTGTATITASFNDLSASYGLSIQP